MTEIEAAARLARMTASTRYPSLTADDLADLLSLSRRPDSLGLLPSETGWIPTFDLNYGAWEGWGRKMTKCVEEVTFTSHFKKFDQSQLIRQCKMMADHYAQQVTQSTRSRGATGLDSLLLGVAE